LQYGDRLVIGIEPLATSWVVRQLFLNPSKQHFLFFGILVFFLVVIPYALLCCPAISAILPAILTDFGHLGILFCLLLLQGLRMNCVKGETFL
jgi:hypothetical protein